ncbi:MAG: bifunctional 2-polyprenyl-6-hydroxyphenol methylase/3-demethylubiquinol 3-O-methyltransferase UbiG [Gammaproteobacteria bacterium]|nr:bifunctional 2-polyprenyl-6-hydroxyphenol methylase/3-demethylubiquinol 3-O-methyltransferase UbiG [Gammaproteobacteria bacterium]
MTERPHAASADPREVAKFQALADSWWDAQGAFRALHDINPLRLAFVAEPRPLAGLSVLDVGCGGGILAEAMARAGARVTGIDASEAAIAAAAAHAREQGIDVDYRLATVEEIDGDAAAGFDVVTCMELLEHVPDPGAVVAACARAVRPGGHVFCSTISRTPRAWLHAVLGAEYLLRLLPVGTHDYARFVRPSELEAWGRAAGLGLEALAGMTYNPLTRRYRLVARVDVNYLARFRRPRTDDAP